MRRFPESRARILQWSKNTHVEEQGLCFDARRSVRWGDAHGGVCDTQAAREVCEYHEDAKDYDERVLFWETPIGKKGVVRGIILVVREF